MKIYGVNDSRISFLSGLRIWMLLGVLIVVITMSAVIGTAPVRASGSCTPTQCTFAHNHAEEVCQAHQLSSLAYFECPVSDETDDFFFICGNNYSEQDDCGGGPS